MSTDHQITVLDNLSAGQTDYWPSSRINFVAGDVADHCVLAGCIGGIEVVVQHAAHRRVIESIQDHGHNFRTNVIGTFHSLDACRKAGIKRFINASTGEATLGEARPPVHGDYTPQPLSPYGASKLATEGYCAIYTGTYGMHRISLRFSNIYGPGSLQKGGVVGNFFRRTLSKQPRIVYGDGTQKRDNLYIDGLTKGILRAIEG